MRPWIPQIVAAMLFFAALRIGPRQALGRLGDIGATLTAVLLGQVALPVLLALLFGALGWQGPLASALILMAAAAPIVGGANLTLLLGGDPGPALRLLVVGTALLPLTVFPVFAVWPAFGEGREVVAAVLRLMLVIGAATGLAFVLRALLPEPTRSVIAALDGASALMMGIAVIGLMTAFGDALRDAPSSVATALVTAFVANFGLQAAGWAISRLRGRSRPQAVATGICSGNRNMMLFLTILPSQAVEPVLLFLACYQVPMYLTPVLLSRLYRT